MNETSIATAVPVLETPSRLRGALRFAWHYLEMVLAMVAGMVVLDPLWHLAAPGLGARPDLAFLVMVVDMNIGMAGWMALRRHPASHTALMCGAMSLAVVPVLPAYWAGALDADGMEGIGHALMLVLMLVAMLRLRRRHAA